MTHRTSTALRLALVSAALISGCSSDGLSTVPGDAATDGGTTSAGDLAPTHDAAGPSLCDGLDEATCRKTTNCVADSCLECSCTPVYVGCRSMHETPHMCPGLGCLQPECCKVASDCTNGFQCVAPGQARGGGTCAIPPKCTTDGDCASENATWICAPFQSACTNGVLACQPGCNSAADCGTGMGCLATHHCAASPCAHDSDCPTDFHCGVDAGGHVGCTRTPCVADLDCGADYCVEGFCYGSLGQCDAPVP